MPKEIEKLRDKSNKYGRIDQTLKSNGWPDIMDIFQSVYDRNMEELLAKENPEARGAVNALTEVLNDISTELQFGSKALEKYKRMNFNVERPSEE